MRRAEQFGSRSLMAAVCIVLMAQAFHPWLRGVLEQGETAAWLAVLLAALVALPVYWLVTTRLGALPGGNLITLAEAAAGPTGAVITALLAASLLLFHSALVLRETSEMAVSGLYTHTPQTFAMVTLTACVLYVAHGGTAALIRLCRLFFPLLILSLLFIIAGNLGWGKLGWLLPFWGPGPVPLMIQSFMISRAYGNAFLFLLIVAGGLRDRGRLVRTGLVSVSVSAVLAAAVIAILLMTYPFPLGLQLNYPLFHMSRIVQGGRFFERTEGVWVFFWFFGTALHLGALLHAAALAWANAFGMDSHRTVVLPMITITVVLALFPQDIVKASALHHQEAYGLGVSFGLPALWALFAPMRGRSQSRAT